MNQALILIDIQNDYFPGGIFELFEADRTAAMAARALGDFRSRGLPVYHIRHISLGADAGFFRPGTPGSEISPAVSPAPGEKVFIKHAPNAFLETGLEADLRANGIGRLVVCGMMSHMCIDTSIRAAKDLGFSVTLLDDACTTRDLCWEGTVIPAQTVHRAMMAALDGTFADVLKMDAFLSGGAR
jgi:nicotinamidase-related amidase